MDKYMELKEQLEFELSCAIDNINENHYGGLQVQKDISFEFVGTSNFNFLNGFERGMLFAYLSIKNKIDSLEKES